MKTAGRENPERWVTTPSNRALGAEGQNRSCSNRWAAKQEKIQPLRLCFFLTSPFREQTRHVESESSERLLPSCPSILLKFRTIKVVNAEDIGVHGANRA